MAGYLDEFNRVRLAGEDTDTADGLLPVGAKQEGKGMVD